MTTKERIAKLRSDITRDWGTKPEEISVAKKPETLHQRMMAVMRAGGFKTTA